MAKLPVDDRLAVPEEELTFLTSRSSGPGGQNVNKLETRVTVRFDLASASLTDDQRARLRERLATRITRAGILQVTAQRHRTQAANREAAVARLLELLRDALAEAAPRRPTRISRAARARRLETKRREGERKRSRTPPRPDE
jgi:ribosome-associated protein